MRNYMKKKNKFNPEITADELIRKVTGNRMCSKSFLLFFGILLVVALIGGGFVLKNHDDGYGDVIISYAKFPMAEANAKVGTISIPSGTVKANPFLPYRSVGDDLQRASDVPNFELIPPPEEVNENSDAARVMDTIVSGILYDKFSPSAILNIEGNDYLVKKGDIVNNYKVLDIAQNSVSVKLGNNTYKAGIGEILTEGVMKQNDVANLDKKFGGEKR